MKIYNSLAWTFLNCPLPDEPPPGLLPDDFPDAFPVGDADEATSDARSESSPSSEAFDDVRSCCSDDSMRMLPSSGLPFEVSFMEIFMSPPSLKAEKVCVLLASVACLSKSRMAWRMMVKSLAGLFVIPSGMIGFITLQQSAPSQMT
jgi:hypothetical protein